MKLPSLISPLFSRLFPLFSRPYRASHPVPPAWSNTGFPASVYPLPAVVFEAAPEHLLPTLYASEHARLDEGSQRLPVEAPRRGATSPSDDRVRDPAARWARA